MFFVVFCCFLLLFFVVFWCFLLFFGVFCVRYQEAAISFSQSQLSFEEVALKFIKVEHSDALKTFLVKKLASLQEKVREREGSERIE